MERINLVELLKDCIGMELDCAVFNDARLEKINSEEDREYPIQVNTLGGCTISLTKYGTYMDVPEARCIIFPKGKTTWEGFVPSSQFKDGDILSYQCTGYRNRTIYIYRHHPTMNTSFYVALDGDDLELMVSRKEGYALSGYNTTARLATKEEKQKLFDAIKANGYKWDAETKTLEKLNQLKFKNGDIIFTHSDGYSWVSIFMQFSENKCCTYIDLCIDDNDLFPNTCSLCNIEDIITQRLATEEEKEKFFQAIKDNGYKWDSENKTLEKLPKFKVGDKIKEKQGDSSGEIIDVQRNKYNVKVGDKGFYVYFREQDDYELVSDKFDITTYPEAF